MKSNPEMGKTAIQPVPAQTAHLSISGLGFISPRYRMTHNISDLGLVDLVIFHHTACTVGNYISGPPAGEAFQI